MRHTCGNEATNAMNVKTCNVTSLRRAATWSKSGFVDARKKRSRAQTRQPTTMKGVSNHPKRGNGQARPTTMTRVLKTSAPPATKIGSGLRCCALMVSTRIGDGSCSAPLSCAPYSSPPSPWRLNPNPLEEKSPRQQTRGQDARLPDCSPRACPTPDSPRT